MTEFLAIGAASFIGALLGSLIGIALPVLFSVMNDLKARKAEMAAVQQFLKDNAASVAESESAPEQNIIQRLTEEGGG